MQTKKDPKKFWNSFFPGDFSDLIHKTIQIQIGKNNWDSETYRKSKKSYLFKYSFDVVNEETYKPCCKVWHQHCFPVPKYQYACQKYAVK